MNSNWTIYVKTVAKEAEAREAAEAARNRLAREVIEIRDKLDEEVVLRTNSERLKKKLEADNDALNVQLDTAIKNARKNDKDTKKIEDDIKKAQALKEDNEKLKQRITALEKVETEHRKLGTKLAEEQEQKATAEFNRKRLEQQLADAKSDVASYKAQVDKLKDDFDAEVRNREALQANLAKMLGLPAGSASKPGGRA